MAAFLADSWQFGVTKEPAAPEEKAPDALLEGALRDAPSGFDWIAGKFAAEKSAEAPSQGGYEDFAGEPAVGISLWDSAVSDCSALEDAIAALRAVAQSPFDTASGLLLDALEAEVRKNAGGWVSPRVKAVASALCCRIGVDPDEVTVGFVSPEGVLQAPTPGAGVPLRSHLAVNWVRFVGQAQIALAAAEETPCG